MIIYVKERCLLATGDAGGGGCYDITAIHIGNQETDTGLCLVQSMLGITIKICS